ncbi:MAG: DUF1456 family protein, partial [Salibacteraceae bacterium]|nr:DUF1456 family protein [Salibacteraceae bacterium]MDP4965989.1 DUF1456 family protein [Salibacteraceae bacterium]
MTNNDVLKRVRYLLKLNNNKVSALFKLANHRVSPNEINGWLSKEDDPLFLEIKDKELAIFLNGLIIEKRGKREGPQPEPETKLSNNMILRKLKIALNLTTDEILTLCASVEKPISKNELTDFFRNPNHPSYRVCGSQYLRNF